MRLRCVLEFFAAALDLRPSRGGRIAVHGTQPIPIVNMERARRMSPGARKALHAASESLE